MLTRHCMMMTATFLRLRLNVTMGQACFELQWLLNTLKILSGNAVHVSSERRVALVLLDTPKTVCIACDGFKCA